LKIDVENTTIILLKTEDLKKYQLSQLVYYGFVENLGYWIRVCDSLENELLKIIEYFNEESIGYELSEIANNIVTNLIEKKNELKQLLTKQKDKRRRFLDYEFDNFKTYTNTLPRKLKPHQLKSAFHFYTLKNGANFSVPGSGKTSTVLCVYEKLRQEEKCNILFIIGPPSCFQPWQYEFKETLGRKADTIILSGGSKSYRKSEYYRSQGNTYELYLCTFHTALNDYRDIINFLIK